MNKRTFIKICAAATLLAVMSPAQVPAQELPDNVVLNTSPGVPGTAAETEALSSEEVEAALANAIRQSLNQQEDAEEEIAEDDEGEPKKKYRYEKKNGPFSEAELPKRTFNNIPYPY